EVGTLDWAIALQQLLDLINEIATKAGKKLSALIQRQLQQWIAALPSYIKACLPISYCES
ncbi:MAG: transposase, partial [Thermobacillus sp.]